LISPLFITTATIIIYCYCWLCCCAPW